MKRFFLYSLILALTILTAGLLYGEVVDKIVAVVNDEIITNGEINILLAPMYERYKGLYSGKELLKKVEEARKKIIEQLVDDKLVLTEAKKLNIEVDEREIDARVEEAAIRMGSKEKFESILAGQRLTLKDLRQRYKEQIMTRRLVEQKIGSKITITPIEIKDYYDKHSNEFSQPEEIKLRNILIRPGEFLDGQKALNLARDISKRIREGADFASLAKIYSVGPNAEEGGLMGYVRKEELLPAIEKAVFNLKEGDVSGIIQTNLGYHIFKVEEKREFRFPDLSEIHRQIEELIFNEKLRQKMRGWIENMKKNAYIEFK